jgi:hypothetical protein
MKRGVVDTAYDDGGLSGSSSPISAKAGSTPSVYKVDQPMRSLMDFAKTVELLDRQSGKT